MKKLSTRGLMALVLSLTLLVIILGGVVLVAKLRPREIQPNLTATKLSVWEKAVRDNPDAVDNWNQLGLSYLEFERPDDAQSAFETALTLDESNWIANLQLALLTKDEQPKKAVRMLTISTKSAPVDTAVVPFTALGDLLYAQGEYKDARVAYAKGLGVDPAIFETRMGLGRSLQALGDKEGALKQYQEALRLNPGSAEAKQAIQNVGKGIPSLPGPSPTP